MLPSIAQEPAAPVFDKRPLLYYLRKIQEEEMSIDVAEWLNGLGLERYEPAFRENEIDREALPKLTAEASNFAGDSAKAEGSAGQHARTSGRSASSTNAF